MNQNTPGPWKTFRCLEPSRAWSINATDKIVVAGISGGSLDKPDEVIEANARLIAAAPELLAACYEALFAIDTTHGAFRTVENAIAKATGKIISDSA